MNSRYFTGPLPGRASEPPPEGPDSASTKGPLGTAHRAGNGALDRDNAQSGRAQNAGLDARSQTEGLWRMPSQWHPGQSPSNSRFSEDVEAGFQRLSISQMNADGNSSQLKRNVENLVNPGHETSAFPKDGTKESGTSQEEDQDLDEDASGEDNYPSRPTSPVSPNSLERSNSGSSSPIDPQSLFLSPQSDSDEEAYDTVGPLNQAGDFPRSSSQEFYGEGLNEDCYTAPKYCVYSPRGHQRLMFILRSLGMSVYTPAAALQEYMCRNPSIIWHLSVGTTPLGKRYDPVVTGPARDLNDMLYRAICEIIWPQKIINEALEIVAEQDRDDEAKALALQLRKTIRKRI